MENLVEKIKDFGKKHPIWTAIIAAKAIEAAVVSGAYILWPDDTARLLTDARDAFVSTKPYLAITLGSLPSPSDTLSIIRNMPYYFSFV